MLVTADVVGLYPSISHSAGLNSLKKVLQGKVNKPIRTNELLKMTEFVLSNNYFEFSKKVFEQISRAAIGTKFAPICKIKIRLAPNVNTVLMYFFLNSF